MFLSLHSQLQAKKALAAVTMLLLLAGMFSALLSINPGEGYAYRTQCSDGLDNDADGKVDFPEDDDCEDLDDDFEGYNRSGLFVTVTDGKEAVAPGDTVTYVITLKQQRDTHRNITVDLHLPAQTDRIAASDGGSVSPDGRVRWTNVTVYKDVTRTLTVNAGVKANAPQDQLMIARVQSEGEQATDTTRVETEREIQGRFHLVLTDGENSVQPGTTLHYNLRVRNGTNQTRTTDVLAVIPQFTTFVSASPGGELSRHDNVYWRNVTFAPGEEKNYSFAVRVEHRAVDDFIARSRATAGGSNAFDDTSVRRGLPHAVLATQIYSGRNTVERGELLTYTIEVYNQSPTLGTEENVNASLPVYSEFVDVTEGGQWDGKNVRWHHLQIAPNGSRTLKYTIRVRSDAPIGHALLATVQTDGGYDTDHTEVVDFSPERRGLGGVDPSASTRTNENLLFRKVAGADEAIPGGQIRYTIYVKNVLPHPIATAWVTDRFETQHLRFRSADVASAHAGNGELAWNVPVLAPGETWQTSYVLDISPDAPQGSLLANIATLGGPDVEMVPLTERVRAVQTGVLIRLPQTGAAWDVLFVLTSSLTTAGGLGLGMLRRRMYA